MRADSDYVHALADAVGAVHETLKLCRHCCDLTPTEVCSRCQDARRDHATICVVAQPQDRMALERAGVYRGLYHVLHGALSPMNGIGPDQLTVKQLLARTPGIAEVVLATSTTVEGEATAMYLAKQMAEQGSTVSRIAYGLPVGGDLEYADEVTLGRAMSNRRPV